MVALSRFISHLGEKALPLYRLLRRIDHFEWTDAATAGLEEIKAILATNLVLSAPNTGEPMLLYIAATHQVLSAVLVVEREADGHKSPPPKTSVLRVHCANSMQVTVPALSKDSIRGVHGIPEAATLLSRVLHNSGIRSTP